MTPIAWVQIPNVPIDVARRDAPALAATPLVVYTIARCRAMVYAASEDTGVAVGMPLRAARVRCPHAAFLPADVERDRRVVSALATLLGAFSPRVEVVAPLPDAAVALDLGTVTSAHAMGAAARMRQRIQSELGVQAAIGVARSRLVAEHAARCAGAGMAVLVPPGDEPALLATLAIALLPIEEATVRRLELLGLRTAGDVARLPLDALQAQFGGAGQQLYQLARGVDVGPVARQDTAPGISRTRRFAGPLIDRGMLARVIGDLATRLAAQVEGEGWAAGAVVLRLDLDEGTPIVLERRLAEPTSERARLTAALLALGRGAAIESGVTSVTVTACELAPLVVAQLDLFEPAGGQAQRLRAVLDRLQGRFAGSLLRARVTDAAAPLLEQRVRLERR